MTIAEIKEALDRITSELKNPRSKTIFLLEERERLLKLMDKSVASTLPKNRIR